MSVEKIKRRVSNRGLWTLPKPIENLALDDEGHQVQTDRERRPFEWKHDKWEQEPNTIWNAAQ